MNIFVKSELYISAREGMAVYAQNPSYTDLEGNEILESVNVNLGTNGSATERGLHCGYLALGAGGANNNLQPGGAVFHSLTGRDLAAEVLADQLVAIAQPQHGHAQI